MFFMLIRFSIDINWGGVFKWISIEKKVIIILYDGYNILKFLYVYVRYYILCIV